MQKQRFKGLLIILTTLMLVVLAHFFNSELNSGQLTWLRNLDAPFSNPVSGNIASVHSQPSGWKNVAIGGGGYVTGIYFHPQQPDLVYLKTDIGGFYRWQADRQTWLPLTDHFPLSQHNYYGGEALAVDPADPNIVYIAAGKYTADWWTEPGAIFKSTNQGKTWTKLSLEIPMGGNENKRWAGERLAVDPFNSKLLLFGSRRDGLWRSSDAGRTWQRMTQFPAQLDAEIGITALLFNPRVAGHLYAAAYGDGVYQSTDAGLTWRKLEDSPPQVNRLAIDPNSKLYATHTSGVSKYDGKLEDSKWQSITPPSATAVFNALSINPANAADVLVATGEVITPQIFRSRDGGASWTEQQRIANNTVPWWSKFMQTNPWIAAIEFDPTVTGRVWLTDWYGIWRTEDINANPSTWTNYQQGHEELTIFSLIAPPEGAPLLSGVADVDGFSHYRGLDQYPFRMLGMSGTGNLFQDTYSLSYCESNPLLMARVGGSREQNRYGGATSRDGGLTWTPFPGSFAEGSLPLRVAMSATQSSRLVVTISGGQAVQTQDGGNSWNSVQGLPDSPTGPWYWQQPLVADPVDGETFYYYDGGRVYRSQDGGSSFAEVNSQLPVSDWVILKTVPGVAGEIWIGLNQQGLYRSTDRGQNFSRIPDVEAYLLAIGTPFADQPPPVYVYGKVFDKVSTEGIFGSLDGGKSWISLNQPGVSVGNFPTVMEASRQQHGTVFIGTNGRGIYYRALQ